MSKALREADGFGIKPEDGQNLGYDGSRQANVYYSQDIKEVIHGLVKVMLMLDDDQDVEIGTKS